MTNYKIQGRQAIICGSSQGLGRACATSLSYSGETVYINVRNAAQLEATAVEIHALTEDQKHNRCRRNVLSCRY